MKNRRVVLSILIVLLVAVIFIAYNYWFGQDDCLKSHKEQFTYYTYQCHAYSSITGDCIDRVKFPHTGYNTVCDEWKK